MLLGDPVDGHFVIRLTQDQGKTWQRIEPSKLPPMLADEAAFAASGNTLITGKLGEIYWLTGGKSASVYRSTDFGDSWQKSRVPLYQQTATAGGYALAINSQQQLFALGGDYQQRDGRYANMARLAVNHEWHKIENDDWGLRTAMQCIKHVCVATGKLSTDISMDHGQHWQRLSAAIGFYTLSKNGDVIVGAGHDGRVAVLNLKALLAN